MNINDSKSKLCEVNQEYLDNLHKYIISNQLFYNLVCTLITSDQSTYLHATQQEDNKKFCRCRKE